MAQIGEGHEVSGATPRVLTVGLPEIGEILADRYQVEEHVGDDTNGRQLFRGMDIVLRRPVTVVLRHPGGDAASEMLAAAVAASRVVHPHLVGVYDAIDEGNRAYVVREWIDGISLRDAVAEGPIDIAQAIAIAYAVSDAIAALHETGVVHGNVHPGTVMIAQDGRVMLADARASDDTTKETDVQAIGGVLYCALTGFWPHAEAGPTTLPDGVHEDGTLLSPRQLNSDIPQHLDELTSHLLDSKNPAHSAAMIATELAAMAEVSDDDDVEGTFDLATFDTTPQPITSAVTMKRKLTVAISVLVALALAGALAAMQFSDSSSTTSSAQTRRSAPAAHKSTAQPRELKLTSDQARIVLAPCNLGQRCDRNEIRDSAKTIDGDSKTGWSTDRYEDSNFGNLRSGLGVWLDLGKPQQVTQVKVDFSEPGATMSLRGGDSNPGAGNNEETDKQIATTYRDIALPRVTRGTSELFMGNGTPVRYLLIWVSKLPPPNKISIYEITIFVE